MSARSERLRLAIVSSLHSVQGTAHHLPLGTLTVLAERLTQALTPLVSEVGEKATAAAATATPDFFQRGHTYTHSRWQFRCDHISLHPATGEHRALGWLHTFTGQWQADSLDPDDWACGDWTDTTQGDSK